MAVAQEHIIKRQVIELELEGVQDRIAIENKIAELNRDALLPIVERICSNIAGPGVVVELDQLAIDVPAVRVGELSDQWVQEFERAFTHQLRTKLSSAIHQPAKAGVSEQAAPANQRALLDHFLHSGLLPWWGPVDARETLKQHWAQQLEAPDAALATALFRGLRRGG